MYKLTLLHYMDRQITARKKEHKKSLQTLKHVWRVKPFSFGHEDTARQNTVFLFGGLTPFVFKNRAYEL
jgi:prolyl-tRNA editing enzyme YbaK/EbsC (Cys-tRNA(Pro) deacylase)